ncbi:MAG: sugar phosphate isomerase/epimerase [Chloroflexi bacterium]|nr:sugar phosphate isomerase/epimerase [Chloroflexota bacterium]
MPPRIPIGMCGSLEQFDRLAPGYDYLEPMVARTLNPLEDDAAVAVSLETLRLLAPPVRAFNIFVPESVRLTGPEVDWGLVSVYVQRALARAASVGGEVIVFGSGGARRVPEGFDLEEAWRQLVRFLGICAQHAEPAGITIAIEPLYNSNIVTTYLQAAEMARQVGSSTIRVVADIIHFHRVDEPLEDIYQAPEYCAHVHLSDTERRPPSAADPGGAVVRLFEILRDIGYQRLASIEATFGDDYAGESAATLAYLRDLAD